MSSPLQTLSYILSQKRVICFLIIQDTSVRHHFILPKTKKEQKGSHWRAQLVETIFFYSHDKIEKRRKQRKWRVCTPLFGPNFQFRIIFTSDKSHARKTRVARCRVRAPLRQIFSRCCLPIVDTFFSFNDYQEDCLSVLACLHRRNASGLNFKYPRSREPHSLFFCFFFFFFWGVPLPVNSFCPSTTRCHDYERSTRLSVIWSLNLKDSLA